MTKAVLELRLKNMMRLFLQSIMDYEHESGKPIHEDERESNEFVDIFCESEDAFDYEFVLEEYAQSKPVSDEERKKHIVGWEKWCQDTHGNGYENAIETEIDEYLKTNPIKEQ